jgi:hypothetical protein
MDVDELKKDRVDILPVRKAFRKGSGMGKDNAD